MNVRTMIAITSIALMASKTVAAEGETWADKIKMKGDLRFRHEYIDQEGKSEARNRQRIRARLGLEGHVVDGLKVKLQMASGSSDPVSTNQSLDDNFSTKNWNLDRAYFIWDVMESGLAVMGGKMANPFSKVSDLVWDGDLNLEGLSACYTFGTDAFDLVLDGGYFWVEERSSDDDTMLYAGQAAIDVDAGPVSILAGGSYYLYDNIEMQDLILGDSFGNTSMDDMYVTGYELAEGFAKLGGKIGDFPVSVYGNYVVNLDADSEDTGYLAGLKLGKAKNPNSFEISYNYRDLDNDCVVGAFTDSDFGGGGTGATGHKFGAAYAPAKNTALAVTYFKNTLDPDGADLDYDRVQLDFKVKF